MAAAVGLARRLLKRRPRAVAVQGVTEEPIDATHVLTSPTQDTDTEVEL